MNQPAKVIIIIPTYNEADSIKQTIDALFKHCANQTEFQIELLVFDSASKDKTFQIVQALQKNYPLQLHLISEPKKTGLGSAYFQAMRYAISTLSADFIFEYDADGSHQPQYILPMLRLLNNNNDVVVGSRYIKGGKIPNNWGWDRKLFSIAGNLIARAILISQHKDLTSGFRVSKATALKKILPNHGFLSDHYAYKLHLFWLLKRANMKIIEFPIEFIDRVAGQSKLPANSITDSLRVLFTLRLQALRKFK